MRLSGKNYNKGMSVTQRQVSEWGRFLFAKEYFGSKCNTNIIVSVLSHAICGIILLFVKVVSPGYSIGCLKLIGNDLVLKQVIAG